MNWFLVSIKKEKEHNKNISIKSKIQNEFPLCEVEETVFQSHNINMIYVTNQSIHNKQFQYGDLFIIGDIKIHNKKELISKYDLEYGQSNESLVIQMYKRKGIACIDDLVGEFSFVISDKKYNRVYAIRDQIGVKPLFWVCKKDEYIFSSDIFLLKDFFDVQDLNYEYFREFYERNGTIDIPSTPFKQVNRISSGHYVLIEEEKEIVSRQYWDLSDIRNEIRYSNESEYFEKFYEILNESVNCRLIKGKYNSVLLSGGLDSTSIYSLAKMNEENSIASVSAVFDELKECDERDYFEELLMKYEDEGNYVNLDNKLMFEDFPNNIPFTYEPNVSSISSEFSINIAKASVKKGFYNVLSGFGGDQLLTGSLYITRDHLKKLRIKKLFSFLTDYSIYTNTSAYQNMINYTLKPNIVKNFVRNESEYYKTIEEKLKKIPTYSKKELYFEISNAKAHLYIDRTIGGITGTDMNHPFLDRRLIEFMYKIPGDLRFTPEYSKYILRKSMRNILTPTITDRLNKTTHLAYTYKSLKKNWDSIIKVIEHPIIVNELGLISKEEWKENVGKWRNGLETRSDFWTLLAIEIWIKKLMKKVELN
ncbi:asparagine synthase-related protein [Priestia megaterium]|uniref:asparagine synthase-related protein n=1 Tax=Priestia megaterium TaxID=1404 RepID=UPI002E1F442B|nr:asparagine synthase-related protein [Priestia megaterium]MED4253511.1 asparagine synthase-related protein [Priestia megaterium]